MVLRSAARSDPEQSLHRKEQAEWARLMGAGEQVSSVHRLGRSTILFTNRRLVLVEEGATGRRVDYASIPYRSISSFTVEAGGAFAGDADLKIWVIGRPAPIERQFTAAVDVYAVQGLLAQHVSPT